MTDIKTANTSDILIEMIDGLLREEKLCPICSNLLQSNLNLRCVFAGGHLSCRTMNRTPESDPMAPVYNRRVQIPDALRNLIVPR